MPRYIDADLLMKKWLFRGKSQAMYRDEIRSVPTADVFPVVHGEWIDTETGECKCSHCKNIYEIKAKFLYSYCPNCGAKMDERREDG